MKLAFGNGLRVLLGVVIVTALHGCGDVASSAAGSDAQLTVTMPHTSSNRTALKVAAPEYIKTYTIEVRDAAENVIVPSREISASGGEVSLSVPPNTALRVIGAAFGAGGKEEGTARFRGDKVVPPIATGAKASVALILEASVPLSWPVQATGQGPLIAVANIKEVTVITTTAQPDQQVNFSITGGADLFSIVGIDFRSGQLSFNNPPSIGDYSVQVTFTDGFESVVQDLKVQVVARSGGLDTSFGPDGNGIVTKDFGSPPAVVSYDSATAVVMQSNGKIVVAGTTSTGSALVRYTRDGILDETFGALGIVTLSGTINAMALRSDDDIFVAGVTSNTTGNTDFLLAHYDRNGNIDTGFGGSKTGIVTTDIANGSYDSAAALVIQADGKIVVVGSMDNSALAAIANSSNIAVVRYDAKGFRDINFGLNADGIVVADVVGATRSYATAVTLQGDSLQTSGKIVVAGYGTFPATGDDFVLVRYDNLGNLDATFNSTGIVTTNFVPPTELTSGSYDHASGVVVQPDGKIIVVGQSGFNSLAIARYEENGSPDSTFGVVGGEGKVTAANIYANAVVLQPDDKIAIAGGYDHCDDACFDLLVARYNPDGSVDTAFGTQGRVVNTGIRSANALALQTDGKLIAAGYTSDFAIVRYNP